MKEKQFWPGSHLGWPILSSTPWGEGEGGTPLYIGKQEVGTYILASVDFFMKFYSS